MAPLGDVAPALEACRAASRGAGLDVVGGLVLDALRRLVPVEVAVWVDVDVAGGGAATAASRPDRADPSLVADDVAHVSGRPAAIDGTEVVVHGDDGTPGGHRLCLALPAPPGRRIGAVLHRSAPFTGTEGARLRTTLPVLACAVLAAAGRAPGVDCDLLTAREVAVLRSVATGMSDKQAARALGVSPRTVGKHLEHIYAKLGVAGRTEAAALLWSGR